MSAVSVMIGMVMIAIVILLWIGMAPGMFRQVRGGLARESDLERLDREVRRLREELADMRRRFEDRHGGGAFRVPAAEPEEEACEILEEERHVALPAVAVELCHCPATPEYPDGKPVASCPIHGALFAPAMRRT